MESLKENHAVPLVFRTINTLYYLQSAFMSNTMPEHTRAHSTFHHQQIPAFHAILSKRFDRDRKQGSRRRSGRTRVGS